VRTKSLCEQSRIDNIDFERFICIFAETNTDKYEVFRYNPELSKKYSKLWQRVKVR
jgi:hypothetical protein